MYGLPLPIYKYYSCTIIISLVCIGYCNRKSTIMICCVYFFPSLHFPWYSNFLYTNFFILFFQCKHTILMLICLINKYKTFFALWLSCVKSPFSSLSPMISILHYWIKILPMALSSEKRRQLTNVHKGWVVTIVTQYSSANLWE